MKNIFVILISLLPVTGAMCQTRSYEQVDIVKLPGIITAAQFDTLSQPYKQTSRTYFDGLSRPVQAVTIQASPLQKDIIHPVVYNALGQPDKNYLPYTATTTDGSYHPTAVTEQHAFYQVTTQKIAVDDNPYSQQVFENSPLMRVLRDGMTGTGFQPVSGQHYKTISYRSNTTTDAVRLWDNDGATSTTTYAANKLSVTNAIDEQGMQIMVFTDVAGRTILKRQIKSSDQLDTYYVYNLAGSLSYIVPPKAIEIMQTASNYSLTQTAVNKLVFKYLYDGYGRTIEKTTPGGSQLYAVYDTLGRAVLVQDGNLRVNNQWNYIKYDLQGRAISQGIYTNTTYTTRPTMQAYVKSLSYSTWAEQRNATSATGYYTNSVFPTTNIEPLAYSYYDDYDLDGNGTADYSYQNQSLPGELTATSQTSGLPTMVRKRSIGAGLSNIWLTSVTFYDNRLRPIQTLSNNQLNPAMADIGTTVFNFVSVPVIAKVTKVTSATITVKTNFRYDKALRLIALDQIYNSNPTLRIASYEYNELGQLVKKNLHSDASVTNITLGAAQSVLSGQSDTRIASNSITLTDGFTAASGSTFLARISPYLQSVDYRYNIRGQLLSINNSTLTADGVKNDDINDVFGLELSYDETVSGLGNTASYNGQVSAVRWMSRDGNSNKGAERSYKYVYDQLNQLTGALYQDKVSGSWNSSGAFDEKDISYDKNGNILALKRNAQSTAVDNLAYTYDSSNPNRLQKVTDGIGANYTSYGFRNLTGSTGNYVYDTNGNQTADPFKGLTTQYNVLNKTQKVTITTGTGKYINYTYDATGTLLRKQQYNASTLQKTTDYIDGFVYEDNTLAYFATPEGRVCNAAGALKSEYTITDQQGNARVSFEDNGGTAKVIQENSYYAFGLVMPGSAVTTPTTPNKNLYNGGSEWQNDFSNLPDLYQTFFRNYDQALGRWTGVDPDAESAESLTTYQYAGNNPVMFNDPIGDKPKAVSEPSPVYWSAYGGGDGGWNSSVYGRPSGHGGGNVMNRGNEFMQRTFEAHSPASLFLLNAARNGDQSAVTEYARNMGAPTITDISNYISYQDGGLRYYRDDHESVIDAKGFLVGNVYTDWIATLDYDKMFAGDNQWGDCCKTGLNTDQGLALFGAGAAATENLSGIARLGTNLRFYGATANGGVFMGNQFVKTLSILKIGRGAGYVGAIIGTGLDLYGVSRGTIAPGQAIENGIFTTIGLKGGWPGAIVSSVYFGLNAYYPGGANQATYDFSNAWSHHAQSWGQIKMQQGGL
jgi:RHS repeat-associated protein